MGDVDGVFTRVLTKVITSVVDMTTWTPAQAAKETGVSRATIMRMLNRGEFPNAEKLSSGWKIPVTDLGAAGLRPGKPAPPDKEALEGDQGVPTQGDHLLNEYAHEVISLSTQLAEEQRHRMIAEAIAAERERTIQTLSETINDYRRMLPAAPTAPIDQVPVEGAEKSFENVEPERPRWRLGKRLFWF